MPTDLTVVESSRDGALLTPRAPDSDPDDVMVNNERTIVLVDNQQGANTLTVTEVQQQLVDGETPPNKSFTVVTGAFKVCGPWPDAIYNEQSGDDEGKMHLQITGGDGNELISSVSLPLS